MVTASRLPADFASDRAAREGYLRLHAAAIYDALTDQRTRFLRVEALCREAASEYPGLLPTEDALAAEAGRAQRDKTRIEADQGLFLSAVLADPAAGPHLCHAMLLPREESLARRAEYEASREIEFPGAHLRREGKGSVVSMRKPRS